MPTTAVAAKIRSHKFGRRRLTSVAALAQINRKLKLAPDDSQLVTAIQGDQQLLSYVSEMNDAIDSAFQAAGLGATEGGLIKFPTTGHMLIPKSVWLGYITLPTGSLTVQNRTAFQTAEATFNDYAGKLRARVAALEEWIAIRNDMANVPQKPNPGGVVGRSAGGPPHD